jgi:hypothetical protein
MRREGGRESERKSQAEPEVRSGFNEQVVRAFEIENSGKLSFKFG